MKNSVHIAIFALLAMPLAAAGAPLGYSVNSDEPGGDSLYAIDLANGSETEVGPVLSLGTPRVDIEGLAFDPSGLLWAVDNESHKLFPIDTSTGEVVVLSEAGIQGLDALPGHDFGLTFACDGTLYLTSVLTQSLYTLALDGTATLIGAPGNLGVNISAIAAYGSPTQLFGLGNGLLAEGGPQDNRSLYRIDTADGTASLVGEMGPAAGDYFEAGLSFDAGGALWAITDRRTSTEELGSQVLSLDTATGAATLVSTTSVTGFESLAVAPPSGCEASSPPPPPTPPVQAPAPAGKTVAVPTFGPGSLWLAIFSLLLTGAWALRRGSG